MTNENTPQATSPLTETEKLAQALQALGWTFIDDEEDTATFQALDIELPDGAGLQLEIPLDGPEALLALFCEGDLEVEISVEDARNLSPEAALALCGAEVEEDSEFSGFFHPEA